MNQNFKKYIKSQSKTNYALLKIVSKINVDDNVKNEKKNEKKYDRNRGKNK